MMNTETEKEVNSTEENLGGEEILKEKENSTGTENQAEGSGDSASLILEKDKQIAELKDQYIRLMADFDNFRKRTAREKSELIRTAGEEVMLALLPVLDDFERTLVSLNKTENLASIREGIRLVTENFFKALNKKGLEPIQSIGQDFDSSLHEAITSISAGEEKAGKVLDEVEKGYRLGDKVIRFSKVVVGE